MSGDGWGISIAKFVLITQNNNHLQYESVKEVRLSHGYPGSGVVLDCIDS